MRLPSNSYGWVMTAEGIGIVVGSLIIIRKKDNLKYAKLIQFGLFATGGSLIVTAFTSSLGIVLISSCILGLGAAAATIGLRSLIQSELPKDKLGRVFISITFVVSALRTLSIASASILANIINLRTIFLIAAVIIIFAGSITKIFSLNSNDSNC